VSDWRTPGQRARAFATRVAARHGRVRARLAPVARVFARLASRFGIANRITERHTHLSVAPRLALSLVVVREGESIERRGAPLATVVAKRAERIERTVLTRRALVERVVARTARHEGQLPHSDPRTGAIAVPVARVLRRAPAAPVAEREERAPPPRARVSAPVPRAALSPVEVTQLTEIVIRSLDRRLSAARERRGRS